jgi:hypothetical protein
VKWNNTIYVDGGLTDNYPLHYCIEDYLKNHKEDRKVLGHQKFHTEANFLPLLGCNIDNWTPMNPIKGIEDYLYNILGSIMKREKRQNIIHPCTINITLPSISSVEFDINDDMKDSLVNIGYLKCQEYIINKVNNKDNFRRKSI